MNHTDIGLGGQAAVLRSLKHSPNLKWQLIDNVEFTGPNSSLLIPTQSQLWRRWLIQEGPQ